MTGRMLTTAEDIIGILHEEIDALNLDLSRAYEELATADKERNNLGISLAMKDLGFVRIFHNQVIILQKVLNLIEATEEMKQHEQVMNHA